MRRLFKILVITGFLLLILFSIASEMVVVEPLKRLVEYNIYIRAVALFGLIIALGYAWGYKKKIESSQKYRRADEMLAQAQQTARRKIESSAQLEEKLKAEYVNKEQQLEDRLETRVKELTREHLEQIQALKVKNMELKETVANLMRALKKQKVQ